MQYIKQLDSLRAIAVILVIITHWIPKDNILNTYPNGALAVDTFFVLSGFLITNILLSYKNNIDDSTEGFEILKKFYVKRSLRIFPIYYLVVFLLFVFKDYSGFNTDAAWPYLLTYTQNFYFFLIQKWDGIITPLWTLAVEEQFYLVWPWCILFTRKNHLPYLIATFILIGIISQFVMRDINMSSYLTLLCFDSFGLGALLSWLFTYKIHRIREFFSLLSVFAAICLMLFLIRINSIYIPFRTIHSIMALWVITYILMNYNNNDLKLKFILNSEVLIFLGKISYGIYIYHGIIPSTLNSKFINIYLNPYLPDLLYKKYWGQLYFFENSILLILISWASYKYIEKPFLKYKKHFGNEKQKIAVVAIE